MALPSLSLSSLSLSLSLSLACPRPLSCRCCEHSVGADAIAVTAVTRNNLLLSLGDSTKAYSCDGVKHGTKCLIAPYGDSMGGLTSEEIHDQVSLLAAHAQHTSVLSTMCLCAFSRVLAVSIVARPLL